MAKHSRQSSVNRINTERERTFVVQNSYNTEELLTAAKASSIGSTDKRSQLSSESVRKQITQPTMIQKEGQPPPAEEQPAEIVSSITSPFGVQTNIDMKN